MPEGSANGIISHYSITCLIGEARAEMRQSIPSNGTLVYELFELVEETRYECHVVALTSVGAGPNSSAVIFITPPGERNREG